MILDACPDEQDCPCGVWEIIAAIGEKYDFASCQFVEALPVSASLNLPAARRVARVIRLAADDDCGLDGELIAHESAEFAFRPVESELQIVFVN